MCSPFSTLPLRFLCLSLLLASSTAKSEFLCVAPDGSSRVTSDPTGCQTMIALPDQGAPTPPKPQSKPAIPRSRSADTRPSPVPRKVRARFIHPMDFDNSQLQSDQVIAYIKARVRHDYCNSGLDMCQNVILNMMEEKNLKAFKEATKATNRNIMDRVIKDYCNSGLDMCNYTTILMMYKKNVQAGGKSLSWWGAALA